MRELQPNLGRRRLLIGGVAGGGLLVAAPPSHAQPSFPSRPIILAVPFAPGGATDALARTVAQYLQDGLGQQVAVENRPGANGRSGVEQVLRAAPDGHTISVVSTGALMSTLRPNPDSPTRISDVATPIVMLAATPYILTANPAMGRSVQDLMGIARRNPGAIRFGSSGVGSATHLATELFAASAGLQLSHIPYRSSVPAVADLVQGRIQFLMATLPAVAASIAAGQVRALGVTSMQRSILLPDLPTLDESGVPGFSAVGWFGLIGPRGMLEDHIHRIHAAVSAGLQAADGVRRLRELGASPELMSPAEFGRFVDEDLSKWARISRDRNIPLD